MFRFNSSKFHKNMHIRLNSFIKYSKFLFWKKKKKLSILLECLPYLYTFYFYFIKDKFVCVFEKLHGDVYKHVIF